MKSYNQIEQFYYSLRDRSHYGALPKLAEKNDDLLVKTADLLDIMAFKIRGINVSEKDKELIQAFLEDIPLRDCGYGFITKASHGLKRMGGRHRANKFAQFIKKHLFKCWQERVFVLNSEGLAYINKFGSRKIQDSVFFDRTLRISHGQAATDEKFGIVIETSSRRLKMKLRSLVEVYVWLDAFAYTIKCNRYCKPTPYGSFAPQCEKNCAKWYINGEDYFSNIADDIENATSKIYITDWWLSPELVLKRPYRKVDGKWDDTYRLDSVLKRAAQRGCKVYVLLYKEFEHALPNMSLHSKNTLMDLHPNIEVMRHPGDFLFLWSHHEKMVVIDHMITYMGGLDLCFGRYDTDAYSLKDAGDGVNEIYFPGQDYNNVREKDFRNVNKHMLTLIDKNSTPRMPWRDIAIRLEGEVVRDTARHFIQYWNYAKRDLAERKDNKNQVPHTETKGTKNSAKFSMTVLHHNKTLLPGSGQLVTSPIPKSHRPTPNRVLSSDLEPIVIPKNNSTTYNELENGNQRNESDTVNIFFGRIGKSLFNKYSDMKNALHYSSMGQQQSALTSMHNIGTEEQVELAPRRANIELDLPPVSEEDVKVAKVPEMEMDLDRYGLSSRNRIKVKEPMLDTWKLSTNQIPPQNRSCCELPGGSGTSIDPQELSVKKLDQNKHPLKK